MRYEFRVLAHLLDFLRDHHSLRQAERQSDDTAHDYAVSANKIDPFHTHVTLSLPLKGAVGL